LRFVCMLVFWGWYFVVCCGCLCFSCGFEFVCGLFLFSCGSRFGRCCRVQACHVSVASPHVGLDYFDSHGLFVDCFFFCWGGGVVFFLGGGGCWYFSFLVFVQIVVFLLELVLFMFLCVYVFFLFSSF